MRQVPQKTKQKIKAVSSPIFLINFFDQIAITISFPLLTFICFDKQSSLFQFFNAHGSSAFWYGMLGSLPHFIAMISISLLASLSDIFGRKRILLFCACGALIYSITSIVGITYGTISALIIGYTVCGICVRTEPISMAVIADESDQKSRSTQMGLLQFWISLGAFLGPILGGYLAKNYLFHYLNFSLPFFIAALASIITLFITALYFKETLKKRTSEKVHWLRIIKTFVNKKSMRLFVLLLCTQLGWRLYYQFIPPILKINNHYNPEVIGIFQGLIALYLALASSVGIRIINRVFHAESALKFACVLLSVGLTINAACVFFPHILFARIILWAMAIPIAVGDLIAYCMIVTLLSQQVSQGDQGKMMGLIFLIVSLIWAVIGPIGGLLFGLNILIPIVIAPICLYSRGR